MSSGLAAGLSEHVQDPFKDPHSPEQSQNHATKKLHEVFQLNTYMYTFYNAVKILRKNELRFWIIDGFSVEMQFVFYNDTFARITNNLESLKQYQSQRRLNVHHTAYFVH